MKVLITGVDGFIGRNLSQRLVERNDLEIVRFSSRNRPEELPNLLLDVDFVFHLAGVNRPDDPADFHRGNTALTQLVCEAAGRECIRRAKPLPVLISSSSKAETDSLYGVSKRGAEQAAYAIAASFGFPLYLFRLPNVFGKWARPQYNSAVATFCFRISRGLPIEVHDPQAAITLVYIDDVIEAFLGCMSGRAPSFDGSGFATVDPQFVTTVGELAGMIKAIHDDRALQRVAKVGTGFGRALYATYLSYIPVDDAAYRLVRHEDRRGVFAEVLKTMDSGQFSYFTAAPGITRGGHYHHTKVEKFLVVKGQARFRFRNVQTGETYERFVDCATSEVIETIPGWAHDITNVGDEEIIVMLWANEVFDTTKPDTYAHSL